MIKDPTYGVPDVANDFLHPDDLTSAWAVARNSWPDLLRRFAALVEQADLSFSEYEAAGLRSRSANNRVAEKRNDLEQFKLRVRASALREATQEELAPFLEALAHEEKSEAAARAQVTTIGRKMTNDRRVKNKTAKLLARLKVNEVAFRPKAVKVTRGDHPGHLVNILARQNELNTEGIRVIEASPFAVVAEGAGRCPAG